MPGAKHLKGTALFTS